MYSLVDATFGAGYTLGPVLGAALYSCGGFVLPFLASGAAMVVRGNCHHVLSIVIVREKTMIMTTSSAQVTGVLVVRRTRPLARHAEQQLTASAASDSASSLRRVLAQPEAAAALVSASAAALTIGYVESLLELHLDTTFRLSVAATGLCFLAMALAYTSATVLTTEQLLTV